MKSKARHSTVYVESRTKPRNIYRMDVDYVPCCPNCGHKLARKRPLVTSSAGSQRGWWSCSRMSNLLKRKISDIRKSTKSARQHKKREPIICDGCVRRVKAMYTAQNVCVRPFLPQNTRRLDHSSIHGGKDYMCETLSNEPISDADSELFVRNTEYTVVKMEDVLKERLLEECLKSDSIRRRPMNFPRLNHSSDKLRMLFLNEAIDDSLKHDSSPYTSAITIGQESKMLVESSSETTVTQTCYDGSWKRGPMKNHPFKFSRVSRLDKNSGIERHDTGMQGNFILTKSIDILNSNKKDARKQSHMETQYSLRVLKPFKKKKKHKSRAVVTKHSPDMYEGLKHEQCNKESKLKEQHFNSNRRKRKNWMLVKKQKTLKETGVLAKLDGLQTILENSQKVTQTKKLPLDGTSQPVMYMSPSRIMKNLYITRENVETQCDLITDPRPIKPCQCNPKRCCESGAQYSEQSFHIQRPRLGMMDHYQRMIFQCHHQNDLLVNHQSKIIQSPCNHNPPCELVPSCYQAWYTVNYCLLNCEEGVKEIMCYHKSTFNKS